MRSRDWLTLVERKYDDLLHALRCAYMRAAGFKSEVWQEEVILYSNGNISIMSNHTYQIPLKIKDGDAIYISAIKWFDIYEAMSGFGDTAGEIVWLDDKAVRLKNQAWEWATDQLHYTLNDLKLMSDFEESDQIYMREILKT